MTAKQTTQTHVKLGSLRNDQSGDVTQLEARAARFGMGPGGNGTSTGNPADRDKLAARAARFADIKKDVQTKRTAATTTTSTNKSNANNNGQNSRLAERAARFADIGRYNNNKNTLTSTQSKVSINQDPKVAARAARFAGVNPN